MGLSIQGAFSGATTGFSLGASTGLMHAAGIGAVVGGIAGLFGGGSSSGGGGGIKPKKFKSAAKYQNKLTLQSLKRDTALAIQAHEKASRLYEDMVDAQYAEDLKNYEIAIEQRAENYELARDAYEDSVKAFDETVELNDISASMAMNDARRVYNQRRQSLNEQGQALMMQLGQAERDTALNKKLIQSRMATSLKDAQLNAQGINTKIRSAVRDGGDAIKESTRAFESQTKLAGLDLKIKEIQLDSDKKMIKSEMATLEGEKSSIIDSAQLKEQQVLDSVDNTIAESDFAQKSLLLAQQEKYAEAAVQTDQLRRQGLLEQGAQLAKGQSGRSAAKSVQSIAFVNQQAQALLAAALVRSDSNYLLDKKKITQSLDFARTQGKSQLKDTAIGLRKASSEFAAAGLRMSAKQEEMGIRKAEQAKVQENLQDAASQTKFQNLQTSNKVSDAKALAKIDMSKLSNQLLASQTEHHSQLVKNENQLADLRSQSRLSFESLKFAGDSLESELKINKERIKFDEMLANRAAESQVLDEPKLPDLLPPPIKAPPLVQEPLPEIDWKKIKKAMDKARKAGQAYNPSGLSEFTQIMGSVQAIGQQAAAVANAFKPPQQPMQAQDFFPLNYHEPAPISQQFGNIDPGSTWSTPSQPFTQIDPGAWNNTMDYNISTPTTWQSNTTLQWEQ